MSKLVSTPEDRAARKYECCRVEANLRCEDRGEQKYIEHCTCGRRHFIMFADPVNACGTGAPALGS